MPLLQRFCQVLYDSHIGTSIRESDNAFPLIESVHVLGITLLVGAIALLDLRMLGLILRRIPITLISRAVFPLTWSGFAVMFVSGFLLFRAEAAKDYSNPAFLIKLVLLTQKLGRTVNTDEPYASVFPGGSLTQNASSASGKGLLQYIPSLNVGSNQFSNSAFSRTVRDDKAQYVSTATRHAGQRRE